MVTAKKTAPKSHQDIVLDSCVMRLYNTPADPLMKQLFKWLYTEGTLYISLPLVHEYNRHGNPLVASLLTHLGAQNRLTKVAKKSITDYDGDRKFKYLCNQEDIAHARLTFISPRKKLVSFDDALRGDVNRYRSINGVKPKAVKQPDVIFLA